MEHEHTLEGQELLSDFNRDFFIRCKTCRERINGDIVTVSNGTWFMPEDRTIPGIKIVFRKELPKCLAEAGLKLWTPSGREGSIQ